MTTQSVPTAATHLDPSRRHDFVLLFDVQDGNPNGDPDSGNLPRVDPDTMQGLVSDVAVKRKVRDWVDLAQGDQGRFKIYVQSGEALITKHKRAYTDLKLTSTGAKQARGDVDKARQWMCENFYDIRMFGAVMTVGVNCGQVRGPIQITFARSVDPVTPLDLSITRVAVTKEEDAQVAVSEGEEDAQRRKESEMGRKALIPYGLYRSSGFFNASLAAQTGVDTEDLTLFWSALQQMWDTDRSSSRGLMACRGLYIFSHDHRLGNAPAHTLLERVRPRLRPEIKSAREFTDYEVVVADADLPPGITLTRLCG